ncbi:unnamed protein product [Rotaria sordida]|uniref:Uncharacterized protein n=1 Tax=Rotaria sordida TaxID=392033 RepID=A0A818JYW7_9BILA|nr:unnamed protein product [Rotaria sordida]CAF1010987.1 unnamed protein product [Rotaria sordida]CAF3546693.1 unnamed protein product [Rotaria sordida]
MQFLLYLLIFTITFSYTITSDLSTKFNITIKIPENTTSLRQLPYKTVHVKYTLPSTDDQWIIVGIEPFIQSLNKEIQQMTIHLCHLGTHTHQYDTIWYNDETICKSGQSMLIYQWTSYSSLTRYQMDNDVGFQLDKSKLIVFTITYFKERQLDNDQSGVILYISTVKPRFYMGTIVVGNKQQQKHFSCRISNYPRLLYDIQPLFPATNQVWLRIYTIRHRIFGQRIVQSVFNSLILSNQNETNIGILSKDIFLKPDDYLIIECELISATYCKFLIFYKYKNIELENFIKTDHTCHNNDYPNLFELLPSRTSLEIDPILPSKSNKRGITIFLLVVILLFVIWILIILGCVIMRRARGLANFRTEPSTPIRTTQTTKPTFVEQRPTDDQVQQQKLIAAGDRIAQIDTEPMGLTH